jgi:hypothetical protein
MAHINYLSGTIIPKSWLNEVDGFTYSGTMQTSILKPLSGTFNIAPATGTLANIFQINKAFTSQNQGISIRGSQAVDGSVPSINAMGGDADIHLSINAKGAGGVSLCGAPNDSQGKFRFGTSGPGLIFAGAGSTITLSPFVGADTIVFDSKISFGHVSGPVQANIDSGNADNILINTNNGSKVASFEHVGSAVNYLRFQGGATGTAVSIGAGGETNVSLQLYSRGTGAIDLYTASTGALQASIQHTASATRYLTFTGSNGGNPTIGTSAGNLNFSGNIAFSTASVRIIPGTTKLTFSNNAGGNDNLIINDDGSVAVWRASLHVQGALGGGPAQSGNIRFPYLGGINGRNAAASADITLIQTVSRNSVDNVIAIGSGIAGGIDSGVELSVRVKAGVPTTSDILSGMWGVWRDTSGGTTKLYYNNAGTIMSVALA